MLPLLLLCLCVIACGDGGSNADADREYQYVTARSGLRLRSAPSMDATKLALLPPGARVEVLERSDVTLVVDNIEAPWIRVRHAGLEGWVFGGYLGSATQGGNVRASRDRTYVGVWEGKHMCDEERSQIEIRADGTFEARLFGGCDVTGCLCGPASGSYRIEEGGRICFTVTERSFNIVRQDTRAVCYKLAESSLVAVSDDQGFYENYGSELLTDLVRSTSSD